MIGLQKFCPPLLGTAWRKEGQEFIGPLPEQMGFELDGIELPVPNAFDDPRGVDGFALPSGNEQMKHVPSLVPLSREHFRPREGLIRLSQIGEETPIGKFEK